MFTIPMNPIVPAAQKINYLAVLSCLDNYQLPTTRNISELELINQKIYSWYCPDGIPEMPANKPDPYWYINYE